MEIRTQKPFEKPEGGSYLGTIIDVVAKEVADTDFQTRMQKVDSTGRPLTKVQVTFTWTLGYVNGQPAVDSEGRPFQVFETYDAYQNPAKPSKLDQALAQILNAAPPLLSNTDQLEPMLLGISSELYLVKKPKVGNPAEMTVKVLGHSVLKPGQIAPKTPAGFVRAKDRVKGQAGPQPGQTTQTYQQRPAVNLNAGAPAPTAFASPNNEAF